MNADPVKMARTLRVGGGEIDVSSPLVVGIVNATPDSFSDSGERSPAAWIRNALACYEAGAAIVEVGGESNVSNRPPVPAAVEIERVEPVVAALVAAGAVVTIDTHRVETARAALAAGAAIVNDISGLRDPAMIEVCAEAGAGVVLMHTETPPKTPLWDEGLYAEGVSERVEAFFDDRLATLAAAGVTRDRVVLDPGPDFAKTPSQSVAALRDLDRLGRFGCPVMVAVSRKDFVGALTGRRPREREAGTFAAIAAGLRRGGTLLRVHDVPATVDFLRVWASLEEGVEVQAGLRIDHEIRREASADPA
jgi:dihydropteroate synthase